MYEISNIKQVGMALQQTAESLENLDNRVTKIEDETPVSPATSNYLTRKRKARVMHWLGGKSSQAYQHRYREDEKEHYQGLASKTFAEMERDFKDYFQIVCYGDLPKKDRLKAEEYIEDWEPSTNLRLEIRNANSQLELLEQA